MCHKSQLAFTRTANWTTGPVVYGQPMRMAILALVCLVAAPAAVFAYATSVPASQAGLRATARHDQAVLEARGSPGANCTVSHNLVLCTWYAP
jgi:hypothetical protein